MIIENYGIVHITKGKYAGKDAAVLAINEDGFYFASVEGEGLQLISPLDTTYLIEGETIEGEVIKRDYPEEGKRYPFAQVLLGVLALVLALLFSEILETDLLPKEGRFLFIGIGMIMLWMWLTTPEQYEKNGKFLRDAAEGIDMWIRSKGKRK